MRVSLLHIWTVTFLNAVSGAVVHRQKGSPFLTRSADMPCTHGPDARGCWHNGYSIDMDFDKAFPTTGNIVTYDFEITNSTCNPDGHGSQLCLLINKQYPGPTIRANWGDTIVVKVKNSMQDNGTSIHWHGIRQHNSNGEDGVNGITECPLAPGDSKTYSFKATQYGTSWYHAHFSSQYGNGIVGPIQLDGPATANYDIDLGTYPVTDWYYRSSFTIESIAAQNLQNITAPPQSDNILINGTNKNAQGGGQYNQVSLTPGKRYRLRLINTSVDINIRVSLDSHTMQVIAADFIPIHPFTTDTLLLAIGQRYDIIITANQQRTNYYFRATAATDCSSTNAFHALAIWSYDPTLPKLPNTQPHPSPTDCREPLPKPFWPQPVPSGSFRQTLQTLNINLTHASTDDKGNTVVVWALNTSSINIAWDRPTLTYLRERNTSYPPSLAILPTVRQGSWNYFLIQQPLTPAIPHPIHLHGHDFYILGSGKGIYDGRARLDFETPPRRDTALVPGAGWLALAFESNNPGAWLMHCHIAWHISEGLGVQFLESPDQIVMPDQKAYERTCSNWKAYEKTMYWAKVDSGL